MATRYSGNLTIRVLYKDQGHYKCSVTGPGVRWSGLITPARGGFGAGVAYDSEKAYDEIAESALSFASAEGGGGDFDTAEFDAHGYKIRRVANYWKKWPGGQHRPAKLRDRKRPRARAKTKTRSRRSPKSTVGSRIQKHRTKAAAKKQALMLRRKGYLAEVGLVSRRPKVWGVYSRRA